jgi:TorA maturation chaperone TorD
LKKLSAAAKLELQEPGALQLADWQIEADETPYTRALTVLSEASSSSNPETLREEYDDLFTGAGKALVTPYTSGYAVPHAPDRYIVALREHLVAWGLVRHDSVFEIEDHVSAVCDVMRWLIERERPLEEQLAFFNDFVYTGVGTFCDAIEARATTPFYKAVAGVARTFLSIEKEAFDLHTAQ